MSESAISSRASRTPLWLLTAAQQGDPAAERELLRRYEPLVQSTVWKLRLPPGCEREDLAQEARIGLVAAIRAWQPERGPFPALADRCVTNQVLLASEAACRRKHQLLSRAASLDEPRHYASGIEEAAPSLLDTLAAPSARADPESQLLVREQLIAVLRAMASLTLRERIAIVNTIDLKSDYCLAPMLGCTPKAASNVACRARRKLADALPRAA
ncbi:MAG TPA: sigma-70 family RNA polymerase sigma factor [Solirubrobacteraceae bacterium]|jgi:RNA polymerase sigma factor (sigma-70 family)|nr:sigma-70 family RNA polymerase sigma factor [Solirubrobacteraceae bacterium]